MTLDINTIYLIIAILAFMLGGYNFLRKPQEKSEIKEAVFNEKFSQIGKELANLRDNHIHTLDCKLDGFIQNQGTRNEEFSNGLVKIQTILEERLPK